jgi:hypothetical protein
MASVPAGDVVEFPPESFDVYYSDVGWAQTLEVTSDIPTPGSREVPFRVPANSSFMLVSVTTPEGRKIPPGSDVRIEIYSPPDPVPKQAFHEPSNTPELFAHVENGEVVLGIMKDPQEGEWRVVVSSGGKYPFSFHMMTFNEYALLLEVSTARQMPIPFRCRACIWTSKGLGAALGVAAGLFAASQLPPALLDAVSKYLGTTAVIASAFIGKMFEASVDDIAQKICEGIGLCPRR